MTSPFARDPQAPAMADLSDVSSTSTIVGKDASSETYSIRSSTSSSELGTLDSERMMGRSCRSRTRSFIQAVFGWALKILGVLAAVVFGVWAPITYRLQVYGNASNDKSQEKLLKKLKEVVMRIEGVEQEVEMRMGGVGRLRVWEFCEEKQRSTLAACQSATASMNLASILQEITTSYPIHAPSARWTISSLSASSTPDLTPIPTILAPLRLTTASTISSSPTASPIWQTLTRSVPVPAQTSSPQGDAVVSKLLSMPVAVVLGLGFGSVPIIVLGVWVWRKMVKRRSLSQRFYEPLGR